MNSASPHLWLDSDSERWSIATYSLLGSVTFSSATFRRQIVSPPFDPRWA
jgi:hypothetical protein